MLTSFDLYYLLPELKKIENSNLKKVFESNNCFVFEFKKGGQRYYLVSGKNFCYLDSEKLEEEKQGGFAKFLSEKLKNNRVLKVEQEDFDKILIFNFQNFKLIFEFIGKGNIILTDLKNKIITCLFQREFKDRKVKISEKYVLPPKLDNPLLGKIYEREFNGNVELDREMDPRIYYKDGEKYFVSPIELKSLSEFKFKRTTSFSEAIKEFFSEKKKTKDETIRENQKKKLETYKREEEKYRKIADLVLKYKEVVSSCLKKFKKHKVLEKPLREVTEKGIAIFDLEEEVIELHIDKDLKTQIDEFYKKAKKARAKSEKILELLNKKITIKKKEVEKKIIGGVWYEQFRYFFTSNGLLVIAGKDAETNEKLIKKYCKKNDIVLHAHIPGSPFGVIRSEGKEITEQDIKEGAQFVGCYSRFWTSKLGIADVYWVKPEQVTKKAKPGEYVARGSFIIYGKRNFLRVGLKLVVGVDENFRVIRYPENCLKKMAKYGIVLVPGELEGKELGEKIKEKLIEKAKKEDREKIEKINSEEFLRVVPFGKGNIIY